MFEEMDSQKDREIFKQTLIKNAACYDYDVNSHQEYKDSSINLQTKQHKDINHYLRLQYLKFKLI